MKLFRKTIFWLHLVVGLVVGLGVAVMAVTGILIAYEKPILERAERYEGPAPAGKTMAWSVEDLLRKTAETTDATPTAMTAYPDLTRPAAIQLGRERVAYVNNYTGDIVGTEATALRGFFHTVEDLHRWLATTGDYRQWGRAWTGVVNLGFLVLIVSGLWLWLPRVMRWNAFKAVLVPSFRMKGKARDWNWHNVVGVWMLLPLTVIVLTGTIVSYSWANALLFRAVGETPPPPRDNRPQQASGGQPRPGGEGGRNAGGGQPLQLNGLNDLFARAEDASPGYSSITLRLGGGRRGGGGGAEATESGVQFAVQYGDRGSPLDRVTLTYDRQTGDLKSTQAFNDQPLGRRMRSLVVPIHRGELFGLTGMTIAALSSFAALVLVYTGFALSYRRLVRPVLAKIRNREKVVARPANVEMAMSE